MQHTLLQNRPKMPLLPPNCFSGYHTALTIKVHFALVPCLPTCVPACIANQCSVGFASKQRKHHSAPPFHPRAIVISQVGHYSQETVIRSEFGLKGPGKPSLWRNRAKKQEGFYGLGPQNLFRCPGKQTGRSGVDLIRLGSDSSEQIRSQKQFNKRPIWERRCRKKPTKLYWEIEMRNGNTFCINQRVFQHRFSSAHLQPVSCALVENICERSHETNN